MTRRAIVLRGFVLLCLAAACGRDGTGPNQTPVAVAGGPYTTSTGTITVDGSASSDPDGDVLKYRWDFGDGSTGAEAKMSHTYRRVGTFTVTLTVTDAKNSASTPATTTANVTNVPPAVTAGGDKSQPVGTSYTLAASFTDGADGPWNWSVAWGDGGTSTGTRSSAGSISATHTYASEASYEIVVSVTDKFGAKGSDSLQLSSTAPVILAAGDIGDCQRPGDEATAALLDTLVGIVIPLGDNAYEVGSDSQYTNCYAPTWGRQKARTRPVAGNHDYYTANAAGYFDYFGAAAGDPKKGYYSYTLGSWFVIVLNTGTESPDSVRAGSTQEQWLRGELASHSQQCVLALFHHPRFSTILDRSPIQGYLKPIWDALYEYGADLVLNGHDHAYQRFAPQTPDGIADPAFGIRQIAVGTGGGENLYTFADPIPAGSNIQVRDNKTLGVLRVTLKSGSYDWRFLPAGAGTFTDSGSTNCHGRPQ